MVSYLNGTSLTYNRGSHVLTSSHLAISIPASVVCHKVCKAAAVTVSQCSCLSVAVMHCLIATSTYEHALWCMC
jgi:hypothetical protein